MCMTATMATARFVNAAVLYRLTAGQGSSSSSIGSLTRPQSVLAPRIAMDQMPGNRRSGMANGPLDMPGETNLNQHARRGNGTGPFAAFAIILWRPYPGCLLGADGYQMSEPVEGCSGVYQGSGSGRHSMAGG